MSNIDWENAPDTCGNLQNVTRADNFNSVVVPLFNEEESAPVLYEQLRAVLQAMGSDYEILFVDDGSTDNTFGVARDLARKDPRLKVIKFRRNFGQTAAMTAGIDHASGDIIVTMDGDLQNDPTDIPEFIRQIDSGYDIVVGWRQNRQDKLLTRKIPSMLANWLIGRVTGVPIKDNGCSLKAYRSNVIKGVSLYSEMHRFIPAVADISGARIKEIPVRHHARQFGKSKYGLSRIYKVLIDLVGINTIRSASITPIRWFSTLAMPFFLVGCGILLSAFFAPLPSNGTFSIVLSGTGVLYLSLAAYLIFYAFIVELLVQSGDISARQLVANISKPSNRNCGY